MTNRDFYLAVTEFQTAPCGSDRSLEHYLLALHQLCLPLATTPSLSGEAFLQLLDTAFTAEFPPFPEEWRSRTFDEEDPDPGFAGFEACLIQQVVDLREMAERGALEDKYRYFGIKSPRGHSWYNFDPATYLECATAGMYGGWHPDDDTGRFRVPGPLVAAGDEGDYERTSQELPFHEIAHVTWEYFSEFLWCGQIYE